MLRAVLWSLSQGGLPPAAERTPAEEVRVVTFFVVQELLAVLEAFQRACLRGERCHLVVDDRGRRRGRVVIEIRIVNEK